MLRTWSHAMIRRATSPRSPIHTSPLPLPSQLRLSSLARAPLSPSAGASAALCTLRRRTDEAAAVVQRLGAARPLRQMHHSALRAHNVQNEGAWLSPARAPKPFSCALPPAGSSRSLLLYRTPLLRYMRGLGLFVLLGVLPFTAFFSWPIVAEYFLSGEEQRSVEEEEIGGDSADQSATSAPSSRSSQPNRPAYSASHSTLSPRVAAWSLLGVNALVLTSLALVARFNARLVRSVRLYPHSRVLALETVGLLRSPAVPRLVRLDAMLPPLARSGDSQALCLRLEFCPHPRADAAAAHGDPTLSSALPRQSTEGASKFFLFPLPNDALTVSDYTPAEKEAVEQAWHRTLATGLHSRKQMEELCAINELHGN